MSSPRCLPLSFLFLVCLTGRLVGAPLIPAAADRVVENRASVGTEFLQVLDEASDQTSVNFRSFVDPDTAVRLYHRDGGLLFAVTTTRNITPREKLIGEREATVMAAKMLQEKFRHLLETETAFRGFDADTLRVVFVEPDAYSPYIRSSWSTNSGAGGNGNGGFGGAGFGAGGAGAGCSACGGAGGSTALGQVSDGSFGADGQNGLGQTGTGWSAPRPFAPAGTWAAGAGSQAPCTGCR